MGSACVDGTCAVGSAPPVRRACAPSRLASWRANRPRRVAKRAARLARRGRADQCAPGGAGRWPPITRVYAGRSPGLLATCSTASRWCDYKRSEHWRRIVFYFAKLDGIDLCCVDDACVHAHGRAGAAAVRLRGFLLTVPTGSPPHHAWPARPCSAGTVARAARRRLRARSSLQPSGARRLLQRRDHAAVGRATGAAGRRGHAAAAMIRPFRAVRPATHSMRGRPRCASRQMAPSNTDAHCTLRAAG